MDYEADCFPFLGQNLSFRWETKSVPCFYICAYFVKFCLDVFWSSQITVHISCHLGVSKVVFYFKNSWKPCRVTSVLKSYLFSKHPVCCCFFTVIYYYIICYQKACIDIIAKIVSLKMSLTPGTFMVKELAVAFLIMGLHSHTILYCWSILEPPCLHD